MTPTARDIAAELLKLMKDEGLVLAASPNTPRRVDAAAIAEALGRSREWVYEHADRLGGMRVGDGPRPRWSFDFAAAIAAHDAMAIATPQPAPTPRPTPPRRRRATTQSGDLLPIRGRAS
jgi:hypothetical protein